ncbi:mediator of RNA polymerase II transcription subunit 29 [Drosophila eugracilis]|uniref:mediator of RNA polymerase II transcription subunit 29 n=1 Tax=Drosophila eugracilis TaxID=29029 RepID=UPI0007E7DDEA|nr:mediator of RNA polymerase II transcription subunit 29 [Drosophila eugracilis]
MNSKHSSLEEKVKLPPTETISRCYQPQQSNRKVIRILTVAVYVLCVSLAAIMLSLYYIFIWDPTIRPFVTKATHCDKIVIPEKIAIRLLNSSEVTAEQFYKHILEQYRILSHMQQQRQQILQRQHLQLQQLEANNRFQEVFATATIIQAHPHPHPHPREPPKKPLLGPYTPVPGNMSHMMGGDQSESEPDPAHLPLLLDTSPPVDVNGMGHLKRKTHRGHYKHHRARAGGQKKLSIANSIVSAVGASSTPSTTSGGDTSLAMATAATLPHNYMDTPLNPAAGTIVQPPQLQLYTSMPIPLILSPSEEKRPLHHNHGHVHGDRRGGAQSGGRRRTTTASVSGYEAQTYLNPFLTGELIFEK